MSASLNALLERVVKKQAEYDEANIRAKALKTELEEIEGLAAEALGASGLEKVTCAGRSWRVETATYLNVPKDNREAVLQAAVKEGISEELTTVNTSTLKSWLTNHHGDNADKVESLAAGTAFEGLVTEYREIRLRSRVAG